ncbi:eCIS core domain-containing protein [Streptomyces sp. NBC_01431]|uniref:eCIS core domain-containing protein n=1 Tax=Streptomyces sp. NBC_01431 TaxID=2903863 RepID=UPI003FCD08A0
MHAQDRQQGRPATPAAPTSRAGGTSAARAGGGNEAGRGALAGGFTPGQMLALQRSAGNAAVSGLLAVRAAEPVQRSAVQEVLRSPGRPLEAGVRTEMESRLGADFGDVRLHDDAVAQRSAADMGARAYTSGSHIVVGGGGADRHTLAHELTHVIQQRQGPVAGMDTGDGLRVSDPSDAFERAAEANATRALSTPLPDRVTAPGSGPGAVPGPVPGSDGGAVQRECPMGSRPHTENSDVVQRAVGFEFEAQWNVRRVADPDAAQALHRQRTEDRERLLDAKLMGRFLNPESSCRKELSAQEQATSVEDLRAQWFNGELLSPAGELRLKNSSFGRGSQQRAAAEMSLMVSSEVPEKPLVGENLGKGRVPEGLVVRGAKFDLTADASPSGGSNLEWVTDPLNSVAEVGTVLDSITKMATYLNGRERDAFIPSEDITPGGGTPIPRLRIYPFGGRLAFAPQTTAGMRLDRLPDLIGYLSGTNQEREGNPVSGALRRMYGAVTHTADRRAQAQRDLFGGGLGTLPVAKAGAERAVQQFTASAPEGLSLSTGDIGSLTGLVMHLAAYVLAGEEMQDGANAKSIAGGLMARTDFAHNFGLLPDGVQKYFKTHQGHFVDLVLDAADRGNSGAERLFGASVERGLANDRTQTVVRLTRRQWLSALPEGHDLLKNAEHLTAEQSALVGDEPGAAAVHKSLGALGDQDNRVATKKGEIQLLVAELRRMQDRVPAENLKPLALAAFKLIEQLNQGKNLKYPKRS